MAAALRAGRPTDDRPGRPPAAPWLAAAAGHPVGGGHGERLMSIVIEGLHHVYDERGPGRRESLCGIDLVIGDGELVGLAGPTGSGKSTLVQHFNGLLKPSAGRVLVDGIDLWAPGPDQHRRLAEAR